MKRDNINKKYIYWLIAAFICVFGVLLLLDLQGKICIIHSWSKQTCVNPCICQKCRKKKGDALGHNWKEATCDLPETCDVCGETRGDALGHQVEKTICTDVPVCLRCGEPVGKASSHSYETIEELEAATCCNSGKSKVRCQKCGYETVSIIPKSGHKYETVEIIQEYECLSCTEIQQCVFCKEEKKITIKPSKNHEYVLKKDDCKWLFYTCKICGQKKTESSSHDVYISTSSIQSCSLNTDTFTGSFSGKFTCKKCGNKVNTIIQQSAEEFEKTFCSWVDYGDYKEIARFPDDNTGYVMKFTGYILQDCGDNCYRMSTKGKYDDTIYVEFIGSTKGRILEGDKVTVFGQPNKLYTYTSITDRKITIPRFTAWYIH